MTPTDTVSLLVGPPPVLHAAPAQPLTRSTCWGRSCPEGQNALAGRAHNQANKMRHNPNASLGEGQSEGPSPRLLSPQATLLPGLGPRPSSSLSWPLPWGSSTGKVPIGGPFCDPSSWMGAAPHSGATAVSRLDTSAPELSPPISHYDHHYSHYDHCSHTKTTSTAVSRRNGTKALPPARLPGARNRNPLSHKGLRGNRGLGSGPPSRVQRGGRGRQKDDRGVWGAGEGRPCPRLRPPGKHDPARYWVTGELTSINCIRNHHPWE